jgi:probable phosphoglycerate mutase
MQPTRLLAIRHGETVSNQAGRFQGQADSPLSPVGTAQSQALAARLAGAGLAALYSSDLGRAVGTAQLIAAATGLPLQIDARLRERHLGVFQGLTAEEVAARHPEANAAFRRGDPDFVLPQGESMRQSLLRFCACCDELAGRHAGCTIALVTHGGVLSTFLRHVLGLPLDAPRRYMRRNASINAFALEQGKWYLESWGDTAHLAGDSRDDA